MILRQPGIALMAECTASVLWRRLREGTCVGGDDVMYIGVVVG